MNHFLKLYNTYLYNLVHRVGAGVDPFSIILCFFLVILLFQRSQHSCENVTNSIASTVYTLREVWKLLWQLLILLKCIILYHFLIFCLNFFFFFLNIVDFLELLLVLYWICTKKEEVISLGKILQIILWKCCLVRQKLLYYNIPVGKRHIPHILDNQFSEGYLQHLMVQ